MVRADAAGLVAATESFENFTAKYKGELGNSIAVSHCVTDANGVSSFDAAASVGTLAIASSSASGVINGLTKTEADAILVGDSITPTHATSNKQRLTISTVSIGGGDGTPDAVINLDADVDLDATAAYSASGIITELEDGVTSLQSSVISLGSDNAIETGDAVKIDLNGFSTTTVTFADATTGSLVDEQTYFAIRVNDGTDTLADRGKLLDGGTTGTIKLALTYADAINHTDDAPKNIKFNVKPTAADSVYKLYRYDKVLLNVTFTSRYTGHTPLTTVNGAITTQWGDADLFDTQPTVGKAHVVVKDADGKITGTVGSIIEKFDDLSMTPGTKSFDGTSSFITDVLEASSNWIKLTAVNSTLTGYKSQQVLTAGDDGSDEDDVTLGDLATAYDLYKDAADVDISFVLQGKAKLTLSQTTSSIISLKSVETV